MALLQIHMTPLGQGLPSPAMLMFNRPVCSIMPILDCKPLVKILMMIATPSSQRDNKRITMMPQQYFHVFP